MRKRRANGGKPLLAWSDPVYGALVRPEDTEETLVREAPAASVYFLHLAVPRRVKIGFSTNVTQRIYCLSCENRALEPRLIGTIHGERVMERIVHEMFAEHRISGEWFSDEILPAVEALIADDREWYSVAA